MTHLTHFPIEALIEVRTYTYARNGDFHGGSVTLRHVRHARCFGDG